MFKMAKITLLVLAAFLVLGVSITANAGKPSPVEVVNTPDVKVANTTPLAVTVTNDPIWREPFQKETSTSFENFVEFAPVPEGKRLYVEYVSSSVLLDLGSFAYCQIQVRNETHNLMTHFLDTVKQVPSAVDAFRVSTPIKLFANSGEWIYYNCLWSGGQSKNPLLRVGLSGYMVEE